MRIKKGDNVIVISGKDKGRQGKVISALPEERSIIIENINLKKKHQKPKVSGKKGEKIETPRPVSISSVMLVCRNCGKPSRVGYILGESGRKLRICKKCKSEI